MDTRSVRFRMSESVGMIADIAAHPHLLRISGFMPEDEMMCRQVQGSERGLAGFDQGYILDLQGSQSTP
jgi:hypothetical protein